MSRSIEAYIMMEIDLSILQKRLANQRHISDPTKHLEFFGKNNLVVNQFRQKFPP